MDYLEPVPFQCPEFLPFTPSSTLKLSQDTALSGSCCWIIGPDHYCFPLPVLFTGRQFSWGHWQDHWMPSVANHSHILLNNPPVLADQLVKLDLCVADVVSSVERADYQVRPRVVLPAFHQVHLEPVHCDLVNRVVGASVGLLPFAQRHLACQYSTALLRSVIKLFKL